MSASIHPPAGALDPERIAPANADAFRQAMRHLSGAVTVVAARLPDGAPAGLAATAVCSVSAEPAALLTCLNRSTVLGGMIAAGMPFTVNVLAAHHETLARAFGGMAGLDQAGRFALGHWIDTPAGTPMLADALVGFACRVSQTVQHGSHLVVIGDVEHVALPHPEAGATPNLVYHNGAFGRFAVPG